MDMNNMDDRKKILNALAFLKEICKENLACSECPLGTDDAECMMGLVEPYNWDVKTYPDRDIWRAFEN